MKTQHIVVIFFFLFNMKCFADNKNGLLQLFNAKTLSAEDLNQFNKYFKMPKDRWLFDSIKKNKSWLPDGYTLVKRFDTIYLDYNFSSISHVKIGKKWIEFRGKKIQLSSEKSLTEQLSQLSNSSTNKNFSILEIILQTAYAQDGNTLNPVAAMLAYAGLGAWGYDSDGKELFDKEFTISHFLRATRADGWAKIKTLNGHDFENGPRLNCEENNPNQDVNGTATLVLNNEKGHPMAVTATFEASLASANTKEYKITIGDKTFTRTHSIYSGPIDPKDMKEYCNSMPKDLATWTQKSKTDSNGASEEHQMAKTGIMIVREQTTPWTFDWFIHQYGDVFAPKPSAINILNRSCLLKTTYVENFSSTQFVKCLNDSCENFNQIMTADYGGQIDGFAVYGRNDKESFEKKLSEMKSVLKEWAKTLPNVPGITTQQNRDLSKFILEFESNCNTVNLSYSECNLSKIRRVVSEKSSKELIDSYKKIENTLKPITNELLTRFAALQDAFSLVESTVSACLSPEFRDIYNNRKQWPTRVPYPQKGKQ